MMNRCRSAPASPPRDGTLRSAETGTATWACHAMYALICTRCIRNTIGRRVPGLKPYRIPMCIHGKRSRQTARLNLGLAAWVGQVGTAPSCYSKMSLYNITLKCYSMHEIRCVSVSETRALHSARRHENARIVRYISGILIHCTGLMLWHHPWRPAARC